MYSHILMPVSLEEGADLTPLLSAVQQLSGPETKVTLLHVMAPVPGYASSYLPEGYQDDTRQQIETALCDIGSSLSNVEGLVLHGSAIKVIPEFAMSKHVDCVVLSTAQPAAKGLRTLEDFGLLLRQLRCAAHILR